MRSKSLHSRLKTAKMRNNRTWKVKGKADKLNAGQSGFVQVIPASGGMFRSVSATPEPHREGRIVGTIVSIQRTVQNPLFRTIPLLPAYDPEDDGWDDDDWADSPYSDY